MPAVGPGSSIEELDNSLLEESAVSVVVPVLADASTAVAILWLSPDVVLLGDASTVLFAMEGSGDVSTAFPDTEDLVHAVRETRADMPSAAAIRILVASDHSRFLFCLHF